jgi:hypothetical protein
MRGAPGSVRPATASDERSAIGQATSHPSGTAMNRYTIHYRSTGYADETALIVADATGNAYLFSAGELQAACVGGGERGATRLAALLGQRAAWRAHPRRRRTRRTRPRRPHRPWGQHHSNATDSGPPGRHTMPGMHHDDKLRDKLTTYARDLYAVGNQLAETLDKQVDQVAKSPAIQARIRQHLDATKQHRSRMEREGERDERGREL